MKTKYTINFVVNGVFSFRATSVASRQLISLDGARIRSNIVDVAFDDSSALQAYINRVRPAIEVSLALVCMRCGQRALETEEKLTISMMELLFGKSIPFLVFHCLDRVFILFSQAEHAAEALRKLLLFDKRYAVFSDTFM